MSDVYGVILAGSPPVPTNGVLVKAWLPSQTGGSLPASGTAEPGGSPQATVTTGDTYGADGGFLFTGLATGTYYLSWTTNSVVHWAEKEALPAWAGADHWTVNAAGGLSIAASDQLAGAAGFWTSGTITAGTFLGNLTGNVTGNLTGNITGATTIGGSAQITGKLGLNLAPVATLDVSATALAANTNASRIAATTTDTTASALYRSGYLSFTAAPSANTTNEVRVLELAALYGGTSAAATALTALRGGYLSTGSTGAASGTIAEAAGLVIDGFYGSTGAAVTVTNPYGLRILDVGTNKGTGVVTLGGTHALHIDAQTAATGNYALYSAGGQHYLKGPNTTTIPLVVDAPTSLTANLVEWRVAGSAVASISSAGVLSVAGSSNAGNATVAGNLSVTGTAQVTGAGTALTVTNTILAGYVDASADAVRVKHQGASTPTGGNSGDIQVGTGKIWFNDAGTWTSIAPGGASNLISLPAQFQASGTTKDAVNSAGGLSIGYAADQLAGAAGLYNSGNSTTLGTLGVGAANAAGQAYVKAGSTSTISLVLDAPASTTAKLLSFRVNGSELSYVDSAGTLTAPSATFTAAGTGLSLSGNGTIAGTLAVQGSGTAFTVTNGAEVGTLGVGATPNASYGLTVSPQNTLTGTSQYGAAIAPQTAASATAWGVGLYARADTVGSAFTQAQNAGLYVANPTKGSGSTITTAYGLYLEQVSVGATSYQLYSVGGQSYLGGTLQVAGSGTALTVTNTAQLGALAVGGSGLTGILDVNGSVTASAGLARAVSVLSTLTAAANGDDLRALRVSPTVATGTLTGLIASGLRADGTTWTKTGTGTVATAYACYLDAPTIGTTNYGLYQQSGAAYLGGTLTVAGAGTALSVTNDVSMKDLLLSAQSSDPGSPVAGQTWYNSTQGTVKRQLPVGVVGQVGALYVTAAAGTAISNTTTETAFNQSCTLPANSLVVGKVLRVTAYFLCSTTIASVTFRLKLRFTNGSTHAVQFDSGTNTPNSNAAVTNAGIVLDLLLAVTATGSGTAATTSASGRVACTDATANSGTAGQEQEGGSGSRPRLGVFQALTGFDSTLAQTLELTSTCSTTGSGNTITLEQLLVEALN